MDPLTIRVFFFFFPSVSWEKITYPWVIHQSFFLVKDWTRFFWTCLYLVLMTRDLQLQLFLEKEKEETILVCASSERDWVQTLETVLDYSNEERSLPASFTQHFILINVEVKGRWQAGVRWGFLDVQVKKLFLHVIMVRQSNMIYERQSWVKSGIMLS